MKNTLWLMAAVFGMSLTWGATSSDYVQGGIVLHWDGIDNTLTGTVRSHTDAATKWCDLSGKGNDITLPSCVTVEANAMLSAANKDKKPDTNTAAAVTYPTLTTLNGLKSGTNDSPFTVEVVAQCVQWTYTDNYNNLQSIFGTPRGAIGYRTEAADGFYFYYPKSKTRLTLMNWSAGKPANSVHTISAVYGTTAANTSLYLDAGSAVTLDESGDWGGDWYGFFSVFGNQRAKVRIHAIRVYNRVLTPYERELNYQLDRVRFLGATDIPFLVQPIPDQTYSTTACEPDPVVVDPTTGAVLVKGTDYTVSYWHNDRFGTATATISGLGGWAGTTKDVPFLICPSDLYRDIEYIESSGTQVINAEYYPNPTTRMEASIQFIGGAADRTASVPVGSWFGCSEAGGQITFSMNFGGQSSQDNDLYTWFEKSYLGGKGAAVKSFGITAAQRTSRQTFTVNAANGAVKYGTKSFTALTKTTTHAKYPLHLFGSVTDTGAVTPFTYYRLRVYGWKIWDGTTLKRDFVPCYRTFDMQTGLRDKVSGRFFANAGTGNFGYDVTTYNANLPADYQQLSYLTATGGQSIATGVTAAKDITVSLEFLPFSDRVQQRLFGARTKSVSEMTASDLFFGVYLNDSKKWSCCCADGPEGPSNTTGRWSAGPTVSVLGRQSFILDSWGDGFFVNGTKAVSLSTTRSGTGGEIELLKAADSLKGRGRIHSCCIWKAGSLVRKFIPCYRKSDARSGLYDLVEGVFHQSADPDPALHGTGGSVGVPSFAGTVSTAGFHAGKRYANLTNFSFSVWVRNPEAGSFGSDTSSGKEYYGAVVAQGALGGSPGFCCYLYRTSGNQHYVKVQTRHTDGTRTTLTYDAEKICTDGLWHHLAYTFDGTHGAVYLYVDGKLVGSVTDPSAIHYSVAPWDGFFSIGGRHQGGLSYPYRGELSQVTLWSRALSADEVNRLRIHPVTGTEPGLLEAWSLSGGSEGTAGLRSKSSLALAVGDFGFVPDAVRWFVPGVTIIVR